MAVDINDLTFENIGIWPTAAKIVVIVLLCALILGLGFWFDVKRQITKLETVENEEIDLRQTFEIKYEQAVNLEAYKQQVAEMARLFADMLQQLPAKTEVPSLVEDISKMGVANGLTFKLIRPQGEIDREFYAELPIQISVEGNYHQLAEFISSVASLQRIVTINDFTIKHPDGEEGGDDLVMDITAKTYRYLDGDSK